MPVEYKYWDKEKLIKYEEVHKDEKGKWHRVDGPAKIRNYKSGNVEFEIYYVNGTRHRTDGPSWISYDNDGNINDIEYWISGNHLTKKQWEVHPLVIAALVDRKLGG